MRQRDRSAAPSSICTRPRMPTLEYLERLAPSPQVRRRYYLPRSLRRRKASLFPTRPKPVRLPCRGGSTPIRSRRVARAVASVSTRRRDQSLLNPPFQKRDLGSARQMSLPQLLRQRRFREFGNRYRTTDTLRQQGCRPETWRPLSSRRVVCPRGRRTCCLRRTWVAIEPSAAIESSRRHLGGACVANDRLLPIGRPCDRRQ